MGASPGCCPSRPRAAPRARTTFSRLRRQAIDGSTHTQPLRHYTSLWSHDATERDPRQPWQASHVSMDHRGPHAPRSTLPCEVAVYFPHRLQLPHRAHDFVSRRRFSHAATRWDAGVRCPRAVRFAVRFATVRFSDFPGLPRACWVICSRIRTGKPGITQWAESSLVPFWQGTVYCGCFSVLFLRVALFCRVLLPSVLEVHLKVVRLRLVIANTFSLFLQGIHFHCIVPFVFEFC